MRVLVAAILMAAAPAATAAGPVVTLQATQQCVQFANYLDSVPPKWPKVVYAPGAASTLVAGADACTLVELAKNGAVSCVGVTVKVVAGRFYVYPGLTARLSCTGWQRYLDQRRRVPAVRGFVA